MSASEFRIPYQQVSSSQPAENVTQFKICRCGEGDTSENGDSPPTSCPSCQYILNLLYTGIGWTSWKKRWFILTRASLVFFRSDPNVPPPRGAEPIVTLGGIDLNSSGSVVVKEERKLLTVLFPDGRDGRTFTLKASWFYALCQLAETTEDLNEWRSALESALAQAPSVANTTDQNPIFSTEVAAEPAEAPAEQWKIEFSPEEDAHVIGDCIKYVLREMPSSPVPASCCSALVKAYRTDKTRRLDEINRVIYEVFPEPNRQLLQRVQAHLVSFRILKMMQIVGSHKAVNRMSQSALAACMAPLLLRPLLLGECEIDNEFSMGGDGSFQLLQAAAAANHAQAIVIIMMEEFDQIFDDLDEGSCSSEAYTESEDDDVDKEYSTDNDIHDDDGSYDSGEDDIEGLDDNSETYSDGSEHDSKINANVKARKDLSSEEIEFSGDDETLIDKLEHNKIDLQSKIAKEAKENAILHASLERRKEELRERYLALEKEVENLRDQLHKERNLRSSLESGVMNLRRGQTKADLEEVATAESDNMNLKQKASDLRGQVIGQQMCCESCNKRLLNTDRTGGPESVEASSVVGSDSASDMGDVEQSRTHPPSTDKTGQEAVGSITRRAPQRMQSFVVDQEPGGSAVPAASFALAKLTNRLNFLKERRAQLASEMQSLDLGRPPAAAAAAGAPLVKSPTPKGPEKRRS
nr:unnamed protein product [Digitaria exilis]